jgi:hypothetical protein
MVLSGSGWEYYHPVLVTVPDGQTVCRRSPEQMVGLPAVVSLGVWGAVDQSPEIPEIPGSIVVKWAIQVRHAYLC